MVYWAVVFKDGSTGYQVSTDIGTVVIDATGSVQTGNIEYTTVDETPPEPFPAIIYA